MAKVGRPALTLEEKQRRGTLRQCRVGTAAPKAREKKSTAVVRPLRAHGYREALLKYMADVQGGAIVACAFVRLAVERQRRDLARAASDPTWPYVWSQKDATAACAFIEQLPHVEGRWSTPTITLEPFQVFVVSLLFGWRHRSDPSRRRFTTLYFEVARKAAKSTLMAAIGFYHLLKEDEPGASVVCGATTGQQARVVFGIMQRMARRSAFLRDNGVQVFANAILVSDGTARPVNSKASTLDGLNPSCIVLDESHAQDFGLHDVLKSAQGARWNPLLLCPTTAGYDLLSVGYTMRGQVAKVLERVFDADHLLGIIYTLDALDDWRDPSVWVKANPMLGVSPTVEYVRKYCQDAQQAPGLEGEFKVKVCNLWAQSASTWLAMSQWDKCEDATLKVDAFKGRRCWIGADLAQTDDLAAVALVFELGDLIVAFVRFYLPADVVAERARTVPAYQQWVNAGILVLTDGAMIDYTRIEADIRGWCATFNVQAIRFDQYGSAQICSNLAEAGFKAAILNKNRQTFTRPARELETRIKYGKFRHDGNACLRWMASNAVVTRGVDDSILPKKDSSESPNKIDGIDAILEALEPMLSETPKTSIYRTRGALVL
jgi:phage terminase large subunit-like protein